MSINEKKINKNIINTIEKDNKKNNYSFSLQMKTFIDKNTEKLNPDSFSENSSKKNYINEINKITNLSTTYQTLSRDNKLEENNDENGNTFIVRLKDICENSLKEDLHSNQIYKKPKLSLKESRTKLKQLREKLYPLSEEIRIIRQEQLLPVPHELKDDEKFKILRIHNLKKASLPEYKSCEKYENYYKPFEDSLNTRKEFFDLINSPKNFSY